MRNELYTTGVCVTEAPLDLTEKVRVFYMLYGSGRDEAMAEWITNEYAGREDALMMQLERKYEKGKGFHRKWTAVKELFELRDSARIRNIGSLILSYEGKGGFDALLRDLQTTYKTTMFFEKGLIQKKPEDYHGPEELVKSHYKKYEPQNTNGADTLLRAFEGTETDLVVNLLSRVSKTPISRETPFKDTLMKLQRKNTVIDSQALAVHEHAAALRQEATRCEKTRVEAVNLITPLLGQLKQMDSFLDVEEDVGNVLSIAKGYGVLPEILEAIHPPVPAATPLEVSDTLGAVADLKSRLRASDRPMCRLARFCGIDLAQHQPPKESPTQLPHPDAVLQQKAGAPLAENEAVELLASFIYRNM
eukprot:TRINITY_DN31413_c0_g1_i1.p1 TRINITY_DN31413_c0_g1~~TRINITY_DN31413_c0_g1_i1.p1  ORF type:complete len:375 (+),score=73.78 TRINITY_DN31413_c0_g1_i1:42-1127(+)